MANRIKFGVDFDVNKAALNEARNALQEIQKMTRQNVLESNTDMGLREASTQLKKAKEDAEQLQIAITKAYNPKLGGLNLSTFKEELKKVNLEEVYKNFSSLGPVGTKAFSQISSSVLQTNLQLKESHKLLDEMAQTMSNTVKWGVASSIFNNMTSSVQKAFQYTKQLDTALNDIRIVTTKSAEDMEVFAVKANKAAKELGASTLDYAKASTIYYQQGLNDKETAARTDVTLKTANVTGQSGDTTSEQLTAIWNGYKVTANEAEVYIDKVAKVAAATAADLGEMATGMSKVASAANSAGVDIDQLNASLATVISVTREAPETVGTAFKTIYARLGDLKLDGEDEYGVKLGTVSSQMEELGVQILDEQGNMRDMGDIIEDTAAKWQTWSQAQKQAAAIAMAGKMQYSRLIALFDNWDMYEQTLEESKTATGELNREQEIYMESTKAHLEQLSTAWERIFNDIIDNKEINKIIDVFTGATEGVANWIEAVGGGGNALIQLGTIAERVFSKQIAEGITGVIKNFQSAKYNVQQLDNQLEILGKVAEASGAKMQADGTYQGGEAGSVERYNQTKKLKRYSGLLTSDDIKEGENLIDAYASIKSDLQQTLQQREEAVQFIKNVMMEEAGKEVSNEFAEKALKGTDTSEYKEYIDAYDNIDEKLAIVKDRIESVEKAQRDFVNSMKTGSEDIVETEDGVVQSIEELAQEIDKLSKRKDITKGVQDNLSQLENKLNEVQDSFANGSVDDKNISAKLTRPLNKVKEGLDNVVGDIIDSNQKVTKSFDSNINITTSKLNQAKANLDDFLNDKELVNKSKSFINITNSVQMLASAISNLQGIGDIIDNEELSSAEKFLQVTMAITTSLGMFAGAATGAWEGMKLLVGADYESILAATGASTAHLTLAGVLAVVREGAKKMWIAITGPVGLAVAAIAAVVGAFVLLGKSIGDAMANTPENRVKAELEDTKKAIEDATAAYDELKQSIDSYKTGRDKIDELTEGTTEFYEAIVQANQQAQTLIDTLNLMPNSGYTIDKNGLINIDDNVLEQAAYEQMQKVYQAQSKNYEAKANEADLSRQRTVENFRDEVNQKAADQGINKTLTSEQAEKILQNSDKTNVALDEIKRETMTKVHEDKEFQVKQNQLQQDVAAKTEESSRNICMAVHESSVDISDAIANNLASYKQAVAQTSNYEKQAAQMDIYGYLSQSDVNQYKNLSAGSQDAVNSIMAQAKKQNQGGKQYKENLSFFGLDLYDAANNVKWYNPATWGAAIGEKVTGTQKNLREQYLLNTQNYSKQGETWFKNGNIISKEDLTDALKAVDIKDAIKAANSGEYNTEENYKNRVQPILDKSQEIASSRKLDSSASSYITEALLRLNSGEASDDFFKKLTNEEKQALNTERGTKTYKSEDGKTTTNQTIQGIDVDSQYSTEQLEKWLALSDEAGRTIERQKADLQDYNLTLKTQADEMGTTSDALEFYGEAMYRAEGATNDLNKNSAETIANSYKFNKTFNDAVEVFYKNEDAIKSYEKALKNGEKISYDVADAMGDLAKSLKGMGLSLSATSITDNLSDVKKLLTGTQDEADAAYEKLYKISQLDVLENAFGPESEATIANFGASFQEIVDGINSTPVGQPLAEQYANALSKMIQDTGMTMDQIKQLASDLNIEIPCDIKVPEDFKVTEKTFTSKGSATVHRYVGEMPNPNFDGKKDKRETIPVDYSWTEITEDKTESFLVPDATKMTVNQTAQTAGGGTGKRNFSLSTGNTASKKKSEKGSSSKKDPDKMDNLKDEKDRYHDINIVLKQIDTEMSRLEKQKEKLFGGKLIDNLNKQLKVLDKQISATNQKIGIARQEVSELQGKLAGKGVSFNADGTIANYASAYQAQLGYVNSLINQYNSMGAEAQEKYKDTVEKAKKDFDTFKSNIEKYDTLISDTIPGLEDDIQEAIDKKIDIQIEEFDMEIEIRLNLAEAERDWNEFKRKVIDGIKDDDILGNTMAKLADFSSYYKEDETGIVQALQRQVDDTLAQLRQMDNKGWSDVYGDNRSKALEDLKNYYDQLVSNLENIEDLQKEIHDSYIDMMDEAQDKFDDQINTYETLSDLIQHDMKVIQLLNGDEAYSQLGKYYEKQEQNYNKQLDFQRQQVNFWKQQMDTLQEGSDEWEKAKENWMDAVSDWNSAVESAIENLQDKYANAINEIFQNLNNKVTNNMGLDYVGEQWQLINDNADQYLDTVNSLYETQKLESKYLDAIEKTDSLGARRKLKKLMDEELEDLRERDKLTEYDIERANKKYEIALKQIALEEAQQNKSQMRLRRDSQGNYSYQFVADDDEVQKAQDELNDLYNSLYNFDKDRYQNNLDQLYSIWSDFQEKMAEAAKINDPVAREEKELLLKQQYGELINGLVEQNEQIRKNLTESAFDDLAKLYKVDVDNFQNMSDEEKDTLMSDLIPYWTSGAQQMADVFAGEDGFLGVCKKAFEEITEATKDYENSLDELEDTAGTDFDNITSGVDTIIDETDDLLQKNDELINSYQEELDAIASVIAQLDSLIAKYTAAKNEAIAATTAAYNYWVQEQRNAAAKAAQNSHGGSGIGNSGSGANGSGSGSGGSGVGGRGDGNLTTGDTATYTGRYYYDSFGTSPAGSRYSGVANGIVVDRITGNPYGIHIHSADGKFRDLGWVKRSQLSGYDTGGYTGNWGDNDGKLALLHKKELVLNAQDTKNMLNAMAIVRQVTDSIGSSVLAKLSSLSANSLSNDVFDGNQLEQNVHIDATFPNVTNSHEVEDAINNLVNMATQRIHR